MSSGHSETTKHGLSSRLTNNVDSTITGSHHTGVSHKRRANKSLTTNSEHRGGVWYNTPSDNLTLVLGVRGGIARGPRRSSAVVHRKAGISRALRPRMSMTGQDDCSCADGVSRKPGSARSRYLAGHAYLKVGFRCYLSVSRSRNYLTCKTSLVSEWPGLSMYLCRRCHLCPR